MRFVIYLGKYENVLQFFSWDSPGNFLKNFLKVHLFVVDNWRFGKLPRLHCICSNKKMFISHFNLSEVAYFWSKYLFENKWCAATTDNASIYKKNSKAWLSQRGLIVIFHCVKTVSYISRWRIHWIVCMIIGWYFVQFQKSTFLIGWFSIEKKNIFCCCRNEYTYHEWYLLYLSNIYIYIYILITAHLIEKTIQQFIADLW